MLTNKKIQCWTNVTLFTSLKWNETLNYSFQHMENFISTLYHHQHQLPHRKLPHMDIKQSGCQDIWAMSVWTATLKINRSNKIGCPVVDYSQHNSVLYDFVCSSKVKKSKLDELDRIIERRKVAHVSSFMLNWQLYIWVHRPFNCACLWYC